MWGSGPVNPNAGKSKRITLRLTFSSCTHPSQVCKLAEVPCSSTMGNGSSRGPSSRKCTSIPKTGINFDGGTAQRADKSCAVRSGAQVENTAAPAKTTQATRNTTKICRKSFMVHTLHVSLTMLSTYKPVHKFCTSTQLSTSWNTFTNLFMLGNHPKTTSPTALHAP